MSEKTRHRATAEGLNDSPSVAKQPPSQERLRFYEFGPFRLDPAERTLFRGNEIVPLTPKAFDTLLLLVRNSGHLLEKDELIRALWPNTFVEEGSLSNNIFLLRKALGEDPAFIETVRGGVTVSSAPCGSYQRQRLFRWKRRLVNRKPKRPNRTFCLAA